MRAAIDHNLSAARPLLEIDIAPDTPTAEKVDRIVAARVRLFEATAPAARAARVSAHRHEVLAAQIQESRAFLRAQLRRTFAPELTRRARHPLPRAGRALLVRDLRAAPAGPGHVVPARREGPHRRDRRARRDPVTWTHEDGGPNRRQITPGGLGLEAGASLDVDVRTAPVTTMAVAGAEHLFLLRHEPGHVPPVLRRTAGPTIPRRARTVARPRRRSDVARRARCRRRRRRCTSCSATTRTGSTTDLQVAARRTLPRDRPYNSFVPLPDGHLVTKDFGGSLPHQRLAPEDREPCELVVLDPIDLEIVARLVMPEPSIARLSADGANVYVVGDTSLRRARWDGTALVLDDDFVATYRTLDGQTYGWDCVLAGGAAWFLDDGDGAEAYDGTLRGHGLSTAPLHLVRVDLESAEVSMAEVCGRPGGLVANPPVVDEAQRRRRRLRQRQRRA